ncbi:hypothetical protein RJO15_20230 [Herbaspirillum huttiense F1]|uniref:hypothetical protein n=1 Tax=Herbaspirillum huttiense TaxID=863372 RepID=UPI00288648AC|nr:hypothetical protein [Herbaspirillum huttiense]MDT0358127.1 hypothetical protein [Herbaspirillum huttiense F1]
MNSDLSFQAVSFNNMILNEEQPTTIHAQVDERRAPHCALTIEQATGEAARGRRRLEAYILQTVPSLLDASASSLSYSTAAQNGESLFARSLASGSLWAMTGISSAVYQAFFSETKSWVALLSSIANGAAGATDTAAAILSHYSPGALYPAKFIGTISNAFWITGGAINMTSGLLGYLQSRRNEPTSALALTAMHLRCAEGLFNAAAGGVGLKSLNSSADNVQFLNKLSSGLWMAGSIAGAAATAVEIADTSKKQEERNQLEEDTQPM